MTDVAAIGRRHLADALAGKMRSCVVSEWIGGDGEPVRVYWKSLTGAQQQLIEAADNMAVRIALTVKHRARDADGRLIFADVPLESILHDYDFSVIRAVAFLMVTPNEADFDDLIESAEKE